MYFLSSDEHLALVFNINKVYISASQAVGLHFQGKLELLNFHLVNGPSLHFDLVGRNDYQSNVGSNVILFLSEGKC